MSRMVSAVATLAVVTSGAALCATTPRSPATLAASSPLPQSAPPLPTETLTVEKLGPKGPHRVYVLDESFNNEIVSRIWVFDGDTHRRLGQIDTGFMPGVSVSPDGKTTVVATTYFARGGHGTRVDVVEFNDNETLAKTGEIVIPPKHAQTMAMLFGLAYSQDGRFIYAPYVTPAESIGVLDPAKKTVVGEINTAGCTLAYPSGNNRVSSICESGRLLTITLDSQGHEASRANSEPFFDVDKDPVFAQAVPIPDGYAFVSFLGSVHEVDFTGTAPVFRTPWPLVTGADQGAWRPGGNQIGALHRSLGRLYVAMHRGGEGTHKEGGTEIWVFDMKSHQRVARWPVNTGESGAVAALQVTQDAAPLLFAATEKADMVISDALTGRLKHIEKNLGATPLLIMNP